MQALVQRHSDEDFAILGINTDQDPSYYRKQCERMGVTWPSIMAGSTSGKIPRAWGVSGYPTMYVLDREGVIRSLSPRGKELERVVDELIAEGS